MKIFLSYPSARRDVALRLKLALEAEGHELFFDRDDLPPGEAFHQAIRQSLQAAELFVFLVAPESVAPGGYALAELSLAEARWPRPAGHVLPVVVAPTPKASIPPYLLAVTLLEPQGDVVAETVARVAALAAGRPPWARRGVAAVAAVLALALAAGLGWRQVQHQRAQAARLGVQMQLVDEARRALLLCQGGSPTEGFALLRTLASRAEAPAAVPAALQDCAMQWLRQARVTRGEQSFAQLTEPLRAVLIDALAASPAPPPGRAADLRAHLGWATYLRWRDARQPGIDPTPHYQQALRDDATNPYAHAMWAHWELQRTVDAAGLDAALARFAQALRSGRDNAFVRGLQLSTLMSDGRAGAAMRVADEMRRGGETLAPEMASLLWSRHFSAGYYEEQAAPLLQALPPAEGLATFLWLFPKQPPGPYAGQQALWRLMHARWLLQAGQRNEARTDLQALQQQFRAERSSGSLPDAVQRLLAGP